jgi:shikimate kinase
MRYFLIGFMGSGKSKVGKIVAEQFHLKYIDLDEFIEESEQRSISDIFNNSGETYFRELEQQYLKEIIKEDNILVSTGGGTPTFHNLIKTMNEVGETIYLQCCPEILFKRLHENKEKRPMISELSDKSLKRYIENKIEERKIFYTKATHTICNDKGDCSKGIINLLR